MEVCEALGDAERPRHRPFLIGVSGGTASGKSTVCAKIMELLGQNKVDHHQRKVTIVSQDSFYRVLTPEQKAKALKGHYNFDHPDAFDTELMCQTLKDIVEGKVVEIPTYDFITHSSSLANWDTLHTRTLLVRDTRVKVRVLGQGRSVPDEITATLTKKYADVIIPRGVDNMVAINLIVQHIQDILSGDICKRAAANGHPAERPLKRGLDEARKNLEGGSNPTKRPLLEPSTRPH
ncbi:Uridine-cytidine kinase 1 [Bagarius yarrelli]|uniref:Uridine-cytidine kinase 1 n=1 Tax=Bagarius yarrelli TaxID=175774 RepID=A0A556TU72_BAGYA|nr:Uridine-cytidine kinase 1 [Bagarius yarrelli]